MPASSSEPDIDSNDEGTVSPTAIGTEIIVPFVPLSDFQKRCTAAYGKDPMFQDESLLRQYDHRHGLWWAPHDVLVIPDADALRQEVLREIHDSPHSGHKGVKKTRKLLSAFVPGHL